MRIKWLSLVRTLGLIMVLTYHFFKPLLPGGFFGVDLFFTLSGYLTTALLVEEFRRAGGFNWLAFCKRRFLRIFPPLLLAVLITLPLALLVSPDFTGGIARQAAGALGFVTNYFEIQGGGSYEAQLLPHLYIHTWSLALEMHYYLLWGLAGLAAVFLVRRLVKTEAKRLRALKAALAVPAVVLAALCWWNMQRLFAVHAGNPTAAYFDTASHSMPFFIGSAAGALFGLRLKDTTARRLNKSYAAALSIAVIVFSAASLITMGRLFDFNQPRTYRYGFLLASLLGTALLCAARALHEATPKIKREPRLLSFIADTSYGVYLFHWPLYIISGVLLPQNWLASLVTLTLSAGLAAVNFYGIEPVLLRKKKPNKKVFYPAVALLALWGAAGSAWVFARAPEISSLELPIMIGNVYQDAESAAALQARAADIQAEPLADRHELLAWSDAVNDPALAASLWEPAITIDSIEGGVSFLGDSVALGADRLLRETIPDIHTDSAVSRSLIAGRQILRDWQAEGSLREYVVVSLGTNGSDGFRTQVDGIVEELPAGCRLVLVTPYIGKEQKVIDHKAVAEYYRELARTLPFVTVADWAGAIAAQPDYLAPDNIHLGGTRARQLYVDVVLQGIAEAGGKAGK